MSPTSPGRSIRWMIDQQHWLAESPTMKAMEEQARRVADLQQSPTMKAIEEHAQRVADLQGQPWMKAIQEHAQRVADLQNSPTMRAIEEQARRIAESPWMKKVIEEHARRVADLQSSPWIKAIEEQQQRVADLQGSSVFGYLRRGFAQAYERTVAWLDNHWAELETENPNHPHPVLFLVASFPMAVGLPLYEAAKRRDDDTALLAVLEPVLADTDLVSDIKAAVQSAPV